MKQQKLDFADIAGQLCPYIESILASELPGGRREGSEYSALNPNRADRQPGSFKINLTSGQWSDFATGDKGGDMISLVAYLRGCSQKEAALALQDQYLGGGKNEKAARYDKREKWTPVLPAPEDIQPPRAHYHYGPYSTRWEYRDGDNELLGFVCRFNRNGRDKEILPLVYCRNESGRGEWRWHSFPHPRPLYGLNRLKANPEAPVLIVEGEKCADAGARALSKMAVISWPGGSKATGKVEWTPLTGRKVLLWPDRDRPGYLAMLDIADRIKEADIVIIRPPDGKPKGWDIADAISEGWTEADLRNFIDNNHMTAEECKLIQRGQRDEKVLDSGNGNNGGNGGGNSGVKNLGDNFSHLFHFTDTGNAERLISSYGSMIRYNDDPFKKWFIWDGKRWCEDRTKRIYYYVDQVVADLYREAAESSDKDQRQSLGKWAFKLEDMRRQNSMVAKAETMQDIVITSDVIDQDNYLLNLENGTLDLSSGEPVLNGHRQGNYITKIAPVVYDPDAQCPQWDRFLYEIFDKNEDLITFVKRAAGYSLTGDVSAQCFFFAYGTGMNGKSVFFNTMQMLLGDYWSKAPTEMIMQQQFSQVPTDVADLRGSRMVVCSEMADNRRLSEDRIKDLTGEDQIKARRMRENYFDFKPTHKLWMYGNHKPQIHGTDLGIWRRVRIIPFTVMIPEDRRQPMKTLLEGFRQELSGILNWALLGLTEYMEKGLGEPDAVIAAVDEYRQEMDIVGRFIEENCTINREIQVNATRFWKAYNGWCDDVGEHAMSSRRLNQRLREMGYDVKPGHANKTYIYGITLNQEADQQNIEYDT